MTLADLMNGTLVSGGTIPGAAEQPSEPVLPIPESIGVGSKPEAPPTAESASESKELADGYYRVSTASSIDEALAVLPEDFTVPILKAIDDAQKSSVPAIGLTKIRTELIRELSGQAGCEGDGFDDEPGQLAAGETAEEAAVLCGALAQLIGFIEECLESA